MPEIKKGGQSRPITTKPSSEHLHAVHVNRISTLRPAHGDVVSFMPLQRILVVDSQDFPVTVGYDYQLLARIGAFFRASRMRCAAPFRAAFGVAHVPVDGGALRRIVKRKSRQGEHETYRKTNHWNFSHGRFFSFLEIPIAASVRRVWQEW
jgi:hypothetical protein